MIAVIAVIAGNARSYRRNKWVRRFAAVICKSLITLLRRSLRWLVRRSAASLEPPQPIIDIIDCFRVRRWCGGAGADPPIPPPTG